MLSYGGTTGQPLIASIGFATGVDIDCLACCDLPHESDERGNRLNRAWYARASLCWNEFRRSGEADCLRRICRLGS